MPNKTVYVLGAGFSRDAQVPLQAGILPAIRDFPLADEIEAGSPEEEFSQARAKLTDFIDRVFTPGPSPALEDVFTLLDYSISRREYCAGESWSSLEAIRQALNIAILFVINHATAHIPAHDSEFYRRIAAYLVNERLDAGQPADPFSVVLVNWDAILESSVYWCLNEMHGFGKADIDYCCYTTPLDATSLHRPSILQKALGLFNVKLMKLHGSSNWLQCPNCNRMYTGLGSPAESGHLYVTRQYCPTCVPQRVTLDTAGGIPLSPFLISPTFLKVFDNPHIQMIWHNAYVDLAESNRVAFVGYSLPEADYHFRALLRRAIRTDTDVEAVLIEDDMPPPGCPEAARRAYATERFRAFFGDRVVIRVEGCQTYFATLIGETTLESAINQGRERLARRRRRGRQRS